MQFIPVQIQIKYLNYKIEPQKTCDGIFNKKKIIMHF